MFNGSNKNPGIFVYILGTVHDKSSNLNLFKGHTSTVMYKVAYSVV